MNFNYDDMSVISKQDSKGIVMGECTNCGSRTIMVYREYQYYHVLCENCCFTPTRFKEKSMDRAMKKWRKMRLQTESEGE